MNKSATLFLQFVVVLVGLGALAFLIWEPQVEGRNAHSNAYEIYFNDPFLAYAYTASIPFFMALFQAFKVLGFAGNNRIFSPEAVKALRTMKICSLTFVAFVAGSLCFLGVADDDDRPAGITMRVLVTFPAIVVAAAAATLERLLQNAVDIKSENDFTV